MKPLDTVQTYLDEVAACVMANDFSGYAARISLPFFLLTESASLVVTTTDDLRAGFDDFQGTLRLQHVTDMIRLADSAAALGANLISGSYATHLLSSAHRAVSPFRSQIILRRAQGIWRAAAITNSLCNQRWPILVPNVSPEPERG